MNLNPLDDEDMDVDYTSMKMAVVDGVVVGPKVCFE
jgi:hypothetical protein